MMAGGGRPPRSPLCHGMCSAEWAMSRRSEKITLACIGLGPRRSAKSVGFSPARMSRWSPVRDVEKDGVHYLEWGKNEIRNGIRRLIDSPNWREGFNHVPGGRDVLGKEVVENWLLREAAPQQGALQGVHDLRRLPRATREREGCDRGQGDDARSHSRAIVLAALLRRA